MISVAASQTYHSLYLAVYRAHRSDPETWNGRHCTRVLTAVMGGRHFSWRVVGITEVALMMLHEHGFQPKKGVVKITRAHIKARADTVQELLKLPELSETDFIDFWLKNDMVVLCGPGENRKQFGDNYHRIENDSGALFSSNTISWKHKQPERDCLAAMHASLNR